MNNSCKLERQEKESELIKKMNKIFVQLEQIIYGLDKQTWNVRTTKLHYLRVWGKPENSYIWFPLAHCQSVVQAAYDFHKKITRLERGFVQKGEKRARGPLVTRR